VPEKAPGRWHGGGPKMKAPPRGGTTSATAGRKAETGSQGESPPLFKLPPTLREDRPFGTRRNGPKRRPAPRCTLRVRSVPGLTGALDLCPRSTLSKVHAGEQEELAERR
jgi:hypothetical protein